MEFKEKIVSRLKDLLKRENLEEVREEIENNIAEFKKLFEEDKEKKLEAFVADGDKPEFFEMPVDEYDKLFEELNDRYVNVLKERKERKKREEDKNYEIKQELIKEFTELIEKEDVIAEAFKKFNALQEKWNSIGSVPSHKYKELQAEFRKKIEEFYYHINIYKELKINDLKKNLEKKEDLIQRMEKLREETNIKEIEILHKAYMLEWDQLGPTFKENWEEIKARFYDLSHQLSDKVKNHYKGIREQQKENLEKKQALVAELKEQIESELKNVSDWNKATEKVKKLQSDWKQIGFATKNQNQKVWEEFRELGNQFFSSKSEYFKGIISEQSKVKDVKKSLIDKAKELVDIDLNDESFDWKQRTRQVIDLQKKWKEAGAAARHDEQKLWKKFRAECDAFFQKKDEFFSGKEDRQKANLKLKEEVISKVKSWKPSKDKTKDLEALQAFSTEWSGIGFVPGKHKDKISRDFAQALDAAYGTLDVSPEERVSLAFKGKLDQLLGQQDQIRALSEERRRLQDRKSKLSDEKLQYENNLAFFSNAKDDNPLLKEAKQKIENADKAIDEIEQKVKLVNIEINRLKREAAQAEQEQAEETEGED